LGEVEQIVVSLHIARPIFEAFAAIARLVQFVGLNHRAHGAINDDNSLAQQGEELVCTIRLMFDLHRKLIQSKTDELAARRKKALHESG
jgi:hypothetical protein